MLDQAVLRLVLPLGLFLPGDKSLLVIRPAATPAPSTVGADCSDSGNLTPALPLITVHAEFAMRLTPPAGETWTSVPSRVHGSGPCLRAQLGAGYGHSAHPGLSGRSAAVPAAHILTRVPSPETSRSPR